MEIELLEACSGRNWTKARRIVVVHEASLTMGKAYRQPDLAAAMEQSLREVVAKRGPCELVSLMTTLGACSVRSEDAQGKTCLHLCFAEIDETKHLLEMTAMLLKLGADPNHRDRGGRTPLFDATLNRAPIAALRVLVDANADPTIESNLGMSPEKCVQGRHDLAAKQLFNGAPNRSRAASEGVPFAEVVQMPRTGSRDGASGGDRDSVPSASIAGATVTAAASSALEKKSKAKYDVFLGHSWGQDERDHARVVRLADKLQGQFGLNVWVDRARLRDDILPEICDGLDDSQFFCACVSREYETKVLAPAKDRIEYASVEFNTAARTRGKDFLIPIILEPNMRVPNEWKGPLGVVMGGLYFVDYSSDELLDRAATQIVDRVRGGRDWQPPPW